MIPQRLVEFIDGPILMVVGTRDEKLCTAISRAMGAIVNEDRETITFFVTERFSERTVENLRDNGRISLTIVEPISHEAYQLKGAYISSRKSNDKEIALQDAYFDKIAVHLPKMGVPEEYWNPLVYKPSVAVTFRVEDIFDQTPGPGAGEKITAD
jgi:hypothetical protein